MRSKQHGKRLRRDGAIRRLEKTVALHEANTQLTIAIMEDHNLSTGAANKVESIRAKKIERAKNNRRRHCL